ncbi:hypothetical protein JCM3770_004288 [Rhodotorula araucariae]
MRPFVVRLDPTTFDPVASAAAPRSDDLARLQQTWNAWNGRARSLLDQNSRIENLYWRRWHMEQRRGPVQHAPPAVNPAHEDLYGLHASVEAHERRRATEDLEAFLRTTLQAAQPAPHSIVPPQPPTFSALTQPSAPPTLPPTSLQPAQPALAPPHAAPQPQRLAYNPSPEWGYSPLPSVSQPHQNRIIATPSWTALISDAGQGQPDPTSEQPSLDGVQQSMGPPPVPVSQQAVPPPLQHPQPMPAPNAFGMHGYPFPTSLPTDPFAAAANAAAAHGVFPFGLPPPTSLPPIPSPGFALPPTATVYSDLPSALSSAPPAAAPPAFFSSYGMYQPVIAPYPRFLTPSPEPSILGELELELGPTTGEFHPSAAASASASAPAASDGFGHVWRDLEGRGEGSAAPVGPGEGKDPFEGMALAQMRSRANSLEALDRDAARFDIGGGGAHNAHADAGLSVADLAAREVERAAQLQLQADAAVGAGADAGAAFKGKRKARNAGGGGKKTKASGGSPGPGEGEGGDSAASRLALGGKKNRNPHSTQLPGNGQRRQLKEEAGEGHEGPVCSHCGSITTPLWRRGPDDELLCNACGLYLKLHSKPRPKTFGKSNASKRSSHGAAAQAAASGVPPSCNNCGATSTPMWRKDPEGRLCCNACSLYYKLHKVNRPASLAQKRQAAAAAKANAAAAAAVCKPAEASSSVPVPAQQPTPAASVEVTPASSTDAPAPVAPAPVAPPPHLPPAFHPSLPPGLPMNPGDPASMHFLPQAHMWPPHPLQPTLFPGGPPVHLAPQPPGPGGKFTLPPALPPPPQGMPPNPFAQTAWGALAYGIVSAAAAEEAGTGPGPGTVPAGSLPPGHPAGAPNGGA